jgi:hypothetical protein
MQKFFEDDWIYPTVKNAKLKKIVWQFSEDTIQYIDTVSAKNLFARQRRIQKTAVSKMNLGDNPYVALSGGVDSQTACLSLKSLNIPFTAAILVFENDFNDMDVNSALEFCQRFNIKFQIVNINVLQFLTRKLTDYVIKYECPSPQITIHMWLYETLIQDYKATSIIAGGNAPFLNGNEWNFGSSRSQSAWMKFKEIHDFNIIGNFIGHNMNIALMFMIATPTTSDSTNIEETRYLSKLKGMNNLGFDVIPQKQKYTGFEKIKKHFEELTGDGWMFEKSFRHPFQNMMEESEKLIALHSEFHK